MTWPRRGRHRKKRIAGLRKVVRPADALHVAGLYVEREGLSVEMMEIVVVKGR